MKNPADYAAILEWETYEGAAEAFNANDNLVAGIAALENRDRATKWNESYEPGRAWYARHSDGTVTQGRAANLPAAKRAAQAALMRHE